MQAQRKGGGLGLNRLRFVGISLLFSRPYTEALYFIVVAVAVALCLKLSTLHFHIHLPTSAMQ